MSILKQRMFRVILPVMTVMMLSACTTTMQGAPSSTMSGGMKDGMSMPCACCTKMMEGQQSGEKKSCCCTKMMEGKKPCGCCGGNAEGGKKPKVCMKKESMKK